MKRSAQIARAKFARALLWLANAKLTALAYMLWPSRRPAAPNRVCVYRVGTIGDVVCALPAIYSIRRAWPDAHLTLLTSPGPRGAPELTDLLDSLGWFDEIVTYYNEDLSGWRRQIEFVRGMRRRGFDAWIELPGVLMDYGSIGRILRNMIIARFAARWGRGWQIGTVRMFRQAQTEVIEFPDETDRLLAIVRRIGFEPIAAPVPLPIADSARETAASLVDDSDGAGGLLVGIAPGAKRPTNRWPENRFAEVARELSIAGFRLVMFGGPGDVEICQRIADAAGGRAINLAGRSTIAESCAVLARCKLLICNDSGVQHLAATMGTPCVSLFAARDFDLRWRPHGAHHTAIRKAVPCHTCLVEVCPYDNHCMKLIATTEVLMEAVGKLNQISVK
jgi:ADP-heptose:LPS heptosyltransferase